MLVLHHATYSINSLCHFFGRQRFKTGDESRNLWWLSVFTFGEAWHNNHHAFPTSARHGLGALAVRSLRVGHLGAREDRPGLGRRAHLPRAPGRQARDVTRRSSAPHWRRPCRTARSRSRSGTARTLPPTNGDAARRSASPRPTALGHVLRAPSQLGVGRAYVSGGIDVDDIDAALALIARWSPPPIDTAREGADRARRGARRRAAAASRRCRRWSCGPKGRRHSILRDKRAVTHHYNLSNEYFALFLDESMTYSCAIWSRGATTLEEAQRTKLELVCTKLGLQPGERVLDVGCGWGAFAIHAAREHGVHVTGITLSEPQAALARERAAAAGLADQVDIRVMDYREIAGETFDAIASIGMVEHVGSVNIDAYIGEARVAAAAGRAAAQPRDRAAARRRRRGRPVLGALRVPGRRAAAPLADPDRARARRAAHPPRRGLPGRLRAHAARVAAALRGQHRPRAGARRRRARARLADLPARVPSGLRERLHVRLPGARGQAERR